MKRYWRPIAQKIDALSLRERAMLFAVVVVVLVTALNTMLIDSQIVNERKLVQQMVQDRMKTSSIRMEIQSRAEPVDPDMENQALLRRLEEEAAVVRQSIQQLEKGLVSPDRIAALLENILRRNPSIALVSLRTLPPGSLTESIPLASAPNKTTPARPVDVGSILTQSIYRHGVEIVVKGSYFDLVQYLAQLESMPWQIFWGKADLKVDAYPQSTLTLNLFTLSLEKSWLDI